MATPKLTVWIGTRKGAFAFSTKNRKTWSVDGPHFRGLEVNHVAQDPRQPKRLVRRREQRLVRAAHPCQHQRR